MLTLLLLILLYLMHVWICVFWRYRFLFSLISLTGLPGVLFVLPDSYVDPENKDYGGE